MTGIEFISSNNNTYFYDNESGFIYTDKSMPERDVCKKIHCQPHASEANISEHLSQYGFKQLILETTQKCNLRCKYCCYGEHYHSTRAHGNKNMPIDVAIKSVDYYMSSFIKTSYKNPLRKPAVTFYGGEPLMHFSLIKKVVEYIKSNYPQHATDYNMTTNGTLLSEEIMDYLIENKFSIIVSLDGNKENHDRNRLKADNTGSFDTVFSNICKLKEKYPGYNKFGISACIDYHTDLFALSDFVKENNLFVVLINMVSDLETDYYERFEPEDIERFNMQMDTLRKQYFDLASQEGMLLSEKNLLLSLFAFGYLEFANHSLINEERPASIPYTASCVPGEKLYVTINGDYHMCERINANFPIGNINEGINLETIVDYANRLNQYYDKCYKCNISRVCNICLARATDKDEIAIPPDYCKERYDAIQKTLVSYVDLMESKPNQLDKVLMSYYCDLREKTGDIYD